MLVFRFPLGSMALVDGGGAWTGSKEKAEKLSRKMKCGLGNVNGRIDGTVWGSKGSRR